MACIIFDMRERNLIKLFRPTDILVETLDVGDVICKYESGEGWIAERKTTTDLAKSIQDGRWPEQMDRLFKSGFTVVYIIEGSLKDANFHFESLLGALINAEFAGAHVFRTWDIIETKQLIVHMRNKVSSACHVPTETLATNKRKKDSNIENIWIRQITCIPSFSEGIARAILTHFGSMSALREALMAEAFPEIPIHPSGRLLGQARIDKLREVFA